jgi:hypothetical protein
VGFREKDGDGIEDMDMLYCFASKAGVGVKVNMGVLSNCIHQRRGNRFIFQLVAKIGAIEEDSYWI